MADAARLLSTIAAPVEHRLEVKRSVFLAHLAPVRTVEQADAVVATVRKEHWDARHHCTALIVGREGERQRSNDDGEPAGTAGAPMLEVLRHREVTDVVAVVTRWFGGTLLGAGGLVRAYGSAVAEALDLARLIERVRLTTVTVEASAAEAGRIVAFLYPWAENHNSVLSEPRYGSSVRVDVAAPPALVPTLQSDLAALSGGTVRTSVGATQIVDRPA